MRKVRAFTRPVILRAIAHSDQRHPSSPSGSLDTSVSEYGEVLGKRGTLLDSLIEKMRGKDGKADVKGIEDELINLLVASRDTVSAWT